VSDSQAISDALHRIEQAKAQYPDTLLFVRLGDFYECYGIDAETVAQELEIVLTRTSKASDALKMTGVPYHAVERYVQQLNNKGYRCAILEPGAQGAILRSPGSLAPHAA
jgi:DNA mismatch repair protein MutS